MFNESHAPLSRYDETVVQFGNLSLGSSSANHSDALVRAQNGLRDDENALPPQMWVICIC